VNQRFGRTYRLHLYGRKIREQVSADLDARSTSFGKTRVYSAISVFIPELQVIESQAFFLEDCLYV
jgi:hypothetical protein